jgi:uncharacterized phage protein (predicted DNA packaging)
MLTLKQAKMSMHITHSIEDDYIQGLVDAAQDFIIATIDQDKTMADYQNNQRFDLAVAMLVSSWYVARGDNTAEPWLPVQVQSLIQQLRGEDNVTD